MHYRKTPPSLTINRLARYLNYLCLLPPEVTHISSSQISRELNIKATQFRQDFHYFGGFGRPGRGYHRQTLIDVLERILGVDKIQEIIIIGMGHLGTALANYGYLPQMNFKIVGLFDSSPKLIGLRVRGVTIRHPSELPGFVSKQNVRIAVITTPSEAAQSICNLLVESGVPGIWNFTPVQLDVPDGFIVRNEQPTLGLLALTFQLKEIENLGEKPLRSRKAYSFD